MPDTRTPVEKNFDDFMHSVHSGLDKPDHEQTKIIMQAFYAGWGAGLVTSMEQQGLIVAGPEELKKGLAREQYARPRSRR